MSGNLRLKSRRSFAGENAHTGAVRLMKLRIVKSEGLAHRSYFLSDDGEAAVIDPRRDCEVYVELAKKECASIRYIFETHRNEDCVTGSVELQNKTEAKIAHSNVLPFKYGDSNLSDGDIFTVGSVRIKVLHTPGHTNESLCYLVYPPTSTEATMVFSGDTLFAGSVGRTDLLGRETQPTQAEKLYVSIHEKLLPLGDHLLVYPAHGAGSVCGHSITEQEPTTIGHEKKTNPYLQLGKDDFVKKSMEEELVVPRYFRRMEEYNLNGPKLLTELAGPRPFSLQDFDDEMRGSLVMIMDTRMPYAYAGAHVPGSLSMWLDGTSVYPGWLLGVTQHLVFIHERPCDMGAVARRLRRLGFDNMCGYLCGGMSEWQEAGKPITNTLVMSVIELKSKLDKGEVTLLDVREPNEWKEDGVVEAAKRVFWANLPEQVSSVPVDKPIAVTCSVGNRSSIAVSILESAGVKGVTNVLGGMTAWSNLGYPTKKL